MAGSKKGRAVSWHVSAVGPARCQAGKGVPSPAAERDGEERKGTGTGRAERRPGGSHQAGRAPSSPQAGCALQPPHRPGIGVGRDDVLLNLAQNKQPSATGQNSQLVFLADREMVEPFSSGPFPDGRYSSVNPLSPGGSESLSWGCCQLPWGWGFSRLSCASQSSKVWHCQWVFCSYCVVRVSPWVLWLRDLLPQNLLLCQLWW